MSIGTDDAPGEWRYELTFSQSKQKHPEIRRELVTHRGCIVIERPDREDLGDPARLSQTYLEQVNVNKGFREIADFLRTLRYLHLVPQSVRDPERSVGGFEDPFGGEISSNRSRVHRLRRSEPDPGGSPRPSG